MSVRRSQVYYNLAHLVAAGVPILRAAKTAGAGMRGKVARAIVEISRDMERGSTIGEGMKKRPDVFPPLDVMVVEVADSSGSLPTGLRMLAQWYELMARVRRTLISGMVLPIVVLNVAAFVYPVPQFLLSGLTPAGYIRQVVTTLMAFYVPIVAIVTLIKLSGSRGIARQVIDEVAIRIPVLGGALREMALSRYCLAFSMMSNAGVSVVTTAQSASELTGNSVIGRRLAGGAAAAKAGNPVVEGFSGALPMDFVEMWRVGEETGDMAAATARMAARYEERAERKFVELAVWLPRIFYFFVCLMIIRMIFSIMGHITGAINNAGDM
jgi:type II secretory pathway component PulF